MKYASLTERIAGDSVDAWDVHYRGMARLEAGEDIILLSVGQESDEFTPQSIVEQAIHSLNQGRHHYTPVEGIPALRKVIAKQHSEQAGQAVSVKNVAVFAGAQNALFAVSQCLLEPGDEVILCEPYYTTYPATVTASGATLVSVPCEAADRFQINPDNIRASVSDRTRAIVLNSPNNPTGAIYSREQVTEVSRLCAERGIWLISDEVYQSIIDPKDRFSAASLCEANGHCITVSSVSKSHRMTGWRAGWVVGPETLIDHLYNLSTCMAYGLPAFIQDAAAYAIANDHETANSVRESMSARRDALVSRLVDVPGLELFSAEGGMFVVFDIRALPISSKAFASGLLDAHDVAVLPCDGFGESGVGLLRISLCASKEKLVVAAGRIVEYVKSIA
ncbi:MAG: pyridoxal phosphate-dependent aminotransferase [Acidiferrobacterales bacterium]|nr:pyridoxal phosphate-dependent aminotransferase [Acidiferrobacterales bacterium]